MLKDHVWRSSRRVKTVEERCRIEGLPKSKKRACMELREREGVERGSETGPRGCGLHVI